MLFLVGKRKRRGVEEAYGNERQRRDLKGEALGGRVQTLTCSLMTPYKDCVLLVFGWGVLDFLSSHPFFGF